MSGTSLDGVDAAWLETDGERIGAFGPALTLPYDDRLRARPAAHPGRARRPGRRTTGAWPSAAARLTEYHVRGGGARSGRPRRDLVGFHGQTILHRPDRAADLADRRRGAAGAAHRRCRWRTISARADVAAGGQGAPLAPVFHAALAARSGEAAGGAQYRRRRQRDLDRAGRRAGRLRHRAGQRPAGRLGARATPARTVRPGRRAGAGRAGRSARCWRGCWRIPISRAPPPKSLDRLDFAGALPRAGSTRCRRRTAPRPWSPSPPAAVAARPATSRRRRCDGWCAAAGGATRRSWRRCATARWAPVRAGRGARLGRRRAGGAGLRLPGGALRRGLPLSFPGTTGVAAAADPAAGSWRGL